MNPISFPTTLSEEEHALKEIHEKLKLMRRLLAERKNVAAGEVSSIEKNRSRKSVEDAAVATEELKRKVIAGAITVKKVNEKHTFKRAKFDKKTRTTSACEEGEIDSSSEEPSTVPVSSSGDT
ncbi:RRM domain-containing protein [Trichostrongylus colubriformis]